MKFDTWGFFENTCRNFQVSLKSDKNKGPVHEDLFMFMTICQWIILRIRSVSDKDFMLNILFYVEYFFPENRAVYEISCKNNVEQGDSSVRCT